MAPLHFLFPADPFDPRSPEDIFREQQAALSAAGFSTSLLAEAALEQGRPLRNVPRGAGSSTAAG